MSVLEEALMAFAAGFGIRATAAATPAGLTAKPKGTPA
jgi:hypothetical protein